MCKLISVRANEIILNSRDNRTDFEILSDMLKDSESLRNFIIINGTNIIASDHAGALRLENDTFIEILPKSKSIADSRAVMLNKLCAIAELPYSHSEIAEFALKNEVFIEFFIEMFIKECTTIIKRGLISEYRTVEENSNILRGRLMFAENIRNNFYHSEKFYIQHEELTFDKAENRLMKSAAEFFLKITGIHRNRVQLRQILRYLDGVSVSENYDDDFAECRDSRNSKKYFNMLNICGLFMKKCSNSKFCVFGDRFLFIF